MNLELTRFFWEAEQHNHGHAIRFDGMMGAVQGSCFRSLFEQLQQVTPAAQLREIAQTLVIANTTVQLQQVS